MRPLEVRFYDGLEKRLDHKIQYDGLCEGLGEGVLYKLEGRLRERIFVKIELGFGDTLGRAVRRL